MKGIVLAGGSGHTSLSVNYGNIETASPDL